MTAEYTVTIEGNPIKLTAEVEQWYDTTTPWHFEWDVNGVCFWEFFEQVVPTAAYREALLGVTDDMKQQYLDAQERNVR